MSMAEDADRNGNVFWSGMEVTPIGERCYCLKPKRSGGSPTKMITG
jgi:hypothetical protein